MRLIECGKEAEAASMEESAKVCAHQERSFMNLFRHMQLSADFFKHFNAMQNLNILKIRTERKE